MAYDPVYAHEYYMKHRKLKGRNKGASQQQNSSTQKLSMQNRGLDKEQKAELKEYWNSLKEGLAAEKENIKEAKEQTIDSMNAALSAKIEQLKAMIKNRAKYVKGTTLALETKAIKNKIAELRQTKKDTRAKIVEISKQSYAQAKEKAVNDYNAKVSSMKPKEKKEKE